MIFYFSFIHHYLSFLVLIGFITQNLENRVAKGKKTLKIALQSVTSGTAPLDDYVGVSPSCVHFFMCV